MSGPAEVLDENARLREATRMRDALLAAQPEQLTAQLAALTARVQALKSSNEYFARHFEFLEARRKLTAAARFVAVELQAPLFEGIGVAAPPRDPERETQGNEAALPKVDCRKTWKHLRRADGTCALCTFRDARSKRHLDGFKLGHR